MSSIICMDPTSFKVLCLFFLLSERDYIFLSYRGNGMLPVMKKNHKSHIFHKILINSFCSKRCNTMWEAFYNLNI